MPTNKDFKRLVRGRMQKTGESYTAAPPPRPAAYATLAGMRDAAVKAKTGCTWERWVQALDRVQAHAWPHREIARHVSARYKIPSWWAQMVTVGYERIRGLARSASGGGRAARGPPTGHARGGRHRPAAPHAARPRPGAAAPGGRRD